MKNLYLNSSDELDDKLSEYLQRLTEGTDPSEDIQLDILPKDNPAEIDEVKSTALTNDPELVQAALTNIIKIAKKVSDDINASGILPDGQKFDPKLVAEDMIRDLCLIGGGMLESALSDSAIDQITDQMFNDYKLNMKLMTLIENDPETAVDIMFFGSEDALEKLESIPYNPAVGLGKALEAAAQMDPETCSNQFLTFIKQPKLAARAGFELNDYVRPQLTEDFLFEAKSPDDIYDFYYKDKIDKQTFNGLAAMDPTTTDSTKKLGSYTKWIIDKYIKGSIKEIDFGHLADCLNRLEAYKRKYSQVAIDIGKFDNLDAIDTFLNELDTNADSLLTKRQKDRLVHKEARNAIVEDDVVFEDSKWTVYSPSSVANSVKIAHSGEGSGSDKFGKVTWCTASSSADHYYNNYLERYGGKYYILINNDNPAERYQWHFESNQFMYANDTPCVSDGQMAYVLAEDPELYQFFASEGMIAKLPAGVPNQIDQIKKFIDNGATLEITTRSTSIPEILFKSAEKIVFKEISALEPLSIPSNLNVIEAVFEPGCSIVPHTCFYEATKLQKVSLCEGITAIGSQAFFNCTSLEEIYIPNSVQKIEFAAFDNCPAKLIIRPKATRGNNLTVKQHDRESLKAKIVIKDW